MLNGKDMESVSMTGLYFPSWIFETLQKKKKTQTLMLLFNTTSI